MENRCSEHGFFGTHSIRLPCYGCPAQGYPENISMHLPHNTNSLRLARNALILEPSAALSGDPTPTPSVNNIF